jgi:hypothetical protein
MCQPWHWWRHANLPGAFSCDSVPYMLPASAQVCPAVHQAVLLFLRQQAHEMLIWWCFASHAMCRQVPRDAVPDAHRAALEVSGVCMPNETLACRMKRSMCRKCSQLSPSIWGAPYGRVAVAFMHVVGLSTLQSWSPDLTKVSTPAG